MPWEKEDVSFIQPLSPFSNDLLLLSTRAVEGRRDLPQYQSEQNLLL